MGDITLCGIVRDGKNDANKWLSRFANVYTQWLGQPIYPGSLNIDTGIPFDWHAPAILPFRKRFSLIPHGGDRDIFMVPCRIVQPSEYPCWLWSTTSSADNSDTPNVVELIAPVQLRKHLCLKTGSSIKIKYPCEWELKDK
jgi:CTP-dependent riboflavin kinase